MRQARQSTGTRLILGHSRPCVVFSGKQAFASICYSSDSKSERLHRIKRTVCVRRLCRSTAPECSSKRVQLVMFSLEVPDFKRGIAAVKYIKDYQQFIKGTRIPDGCEKGATQDHWPSYAKTGAREITRGGRVIQQRCIVEEGNK